MDAQFKITPKTICLATYRTWILPSSRQLRFLHLTIHVRYLKGLTKLIKWCFAIIVMVDTIYSASSHSSLKFSLAFWYCSSCSLATPWILLTPCHVFSSLGLGGDTWEFHLSLLLCIVYICACISFWLINLYLWLVLIFLFSRIFYGFTPLWHHTSQHYMSQHR
jgi:hypothetical protein